jgi:hypothetical protein
MSILLNVKGYLINLLYPMIINGKKCLSFPSRDRATTPGQYEYKCSYS